MKLIYYLLLGLLVGVVISFAIISTNAPQPVLKPQTVITPVPTPQPVYTEEQSQPVTVIPPPDLPSDVLTIIIPLAIVGAAITTILASLLAIIKW